MHTTQRRSLSAVTGIALIFVLNSTFLTKVASAAGFSDLTVTNVIAPASASRASTVNVVTVTMNISSNIAATSSSKFYLCTNNFAYTSGFIGSQSVPSLSGGQSVQLTNRNYIIPKTATLGIHYVIVVCSFGVTDANLSNNTNNTTTINITN